MRRTEARYMSPEERNLANFTFLAVFVPIVLRMRFLIKAGEKGWKALIPVRGTYLLYKLYFDVRFLWGYWLTWLVRICLLFCEENAYVLWANHITEALIYIFVLLPFFGGVKKFGKGKFFLAGMFLLFPIFVFILAFGNDRYIPAKVKKEKTEKKDKKKKKKKKHGR